MSYLIRIDNNLEPLLAELWLDLAWVQNFGDSFSEITREAL